MIGIDWMMVVDGNLLDPGSRVCAGRIRSE